MPSLFRSRNLRAFRPACAPRRSLATRLATALLVVTAGLLPATAPARQPSDTSATLEALNTSFRDLYHQRTQQVLESLPLVLVVQNHTITAVRGTQRRLYPVPMQRYTESRAIVHAVLGFHGLMNTLARADSHAPDWEQLNAFRRDLQRVRQTVEFTALSRNEKSQALEIIERLDAASRGAASARSVTPAEIAETLGRSQPLLAEFSESVGHAHADAMRSVLQKVQSDATPEEWANVVAVVTGPMTPRRNNLETAVVVSALGREHLGTRIFYSENIFTVDGALGYLQTVAGDEELSRNVFGNSERMWEDLFAPVSRTLVEGDFYTELGK